MDPDSLLRALTRAHSAEKLRFARGCKHLADPHEFLRLRTKLRAKHWNVYAKSAFVDVFKLVRYFGRYMRRIAISDRRLLKVDYDQVRFRTKDGGEIWLDTLDFIHRSEPSESATPEPPEDEDERCPHCLWGLLTREELWSPRSDDSIQLFGLLALPDP